MENGVLVKEVTLVKGSILSFVCLKEINITEIPRYSMKK